MDFGLGSFFLCIFTEVADLLKRFTILLAVLAFLLLRKRSRPEEAPPEPPPPRPAEISLALNDENFERWRDFIQPKAGELAWEEIGWRTTLWGGLMEAQAAQRPVLLQVRDSQAIGFP